MHESKAASQEGRNVGVFPPASFPTLKNRGEGSTRLCKQAGPRTVSKGLQDASWLVASTTAAARPLGFLLEGTKNSAGGGAAVARAEVVTSADQKQFEQQPPLAAVATRGHVVRGRGARAQHDKEGAAERKKEVCVSGGRAAAVTV